MAKNAKMAIIIFIIIIIIIIIIVVKKKFINFFVTSISTTTQNLKLLGAKMTELWVNVTDQQTDRPTHNSSRLNTIQMHNLADVRSSLLRRASRVFSMSIYGIFHEDFKTVFLFRPSWRATSQLGTEEINFKGYSEAPKKVKISTSS